MTEINDELQSPESAPQTDRSDLGQTQIAKVKGGFQVMATVQPKKESEVDKLK